MSEPESKPSGGWLAKWSQKTWTIAVAFLCVGPLALPLVWINPRYELWKKVLGSVLMIGATWLLYVWMKDSYERIMAQYRDLKAVMGGAL